VRRVLLLDIETAPNTVAVFRLKQTYIHPQYIMDHGYTLCFTAKWLGKPGVFFAKSPDGHVAMLKNIHALLKEADAVVHYNGKKFDMPTLNAEFLLHGLPPIESLIQIDLFKLVLAAFNFPSYKLDYVCQRLGLGSKVKNGGWEGTWKPCMDSSHKKHKSAWRQMERYNRGDIVLLERLYKKLRPWFQTTHGFKRIHEYLAGLRKNP
jgi:DNA polymerase elongation subunit (family B)